MPLETLLMAEPAPAELPANPLEARLRAVAAALAVGAVVLQASGYLALRFRIRALGIEPEVSVFNEQVLFEGAYLLVFLLTVLPVLLVALAALVTPLWALARPAAVRRLFASVWSRLVASPASLALLAGVWGVATVQLVLRKILHYHDLLFRDLPCTPWWLRHQALADGSDAVYVDAFFALLLLLPVPTAWVARRLWGTPGWRSTAGLLACLALVQVLLVPIHFGVLVRNGDVPRIAALAEDEHAAPGDRTWVIFRTPDTIHFLVRPADPAGNDRILEIRGADGTRQLEVLAFDRLHRVLTEGQVCE